MDKHWSIKTALEQINRCNYECEGGPLKNNVAWRWLEGAAKVGPEFWPGQGVYYEVQFIAADKSVMTAWRHFYVVGCQMDSDTEDRFWTYDLSSDPPAPWHYGTVQFARVKGSQLGLMSGEVPSTGLRVRTS